MINVALAKEMQAIDRRAIEEIGIPGIALMENAGRESARIIEEKFPLLHDKKIIVVCGKGNNGGDGFVVARHLANKGAHVRIILLGTVEQIKADPAVNANIAKNMGLDIHSVSPDNWSSLKHHLRHADVIVDAIFGVGLNKAVDGFYKTVIESLNQTGKYIVALDIPSGIDADSGSLIGAHIKAHLTVALALPKRSHFLYPAASAMGEVRIVDISIPPQAVTAEKIQVHQLEEKDLNLWTPIRPADSHKGSYGHVLVVAGSPGKAGAGALTALSALRSGCGLATLALPEQCQKAVEFNPLEVMSVALPQTSSGGIALSAKDQILKLCENKSALALGPGLGNDPETVELVAQLLAELQLPIVLDADALNALAGKTQVLNANNSIKILSPHPKEMSRLTGKTVNDILSNKIEVALEFARNHNVYLILKGADSLTACPDGRCFINPTGNAGMATAGSGDVLTGIVASLISQGLPPDRAASAGVYIHGLTGDFAEKKCGQASLIASELIANLPTAFQQVFPKFTNT
ncbi:MAG: bifunctional ADP-dependent NAD(P)H-hydrate dehydratase/NAD(P)H-hydrate epimerase [Nitrospinae bacterium CG11_big_fil_rev_8_21_14_0_20_45_15]|nr:MAG: bifunctional ADP-dependent NAD(P)H-hydrate dehydratase/NAD(P)H-hydrate epimerase [Nitrospinae bacterium CG11_big_fil_rev_8_21_14_0_20_45_15]